MDDDPELTAMSSVARALDPLDDDEIERVLQWAADRFGVAGKTFSPTDEQGVDRDYDSFADFFVAADPDLEYEKALVAGYWYQVVEGKDELKARTVNSALKDLGHQISKITRAFNNLIDQDPSLVVQTRKTGSTKQATKRYKLTAEGIRKVEEMVGR